MQKVGKGNSNEVAKCQSARGKNTIGLLETYNERNYPTD